MFKAIAIVFASIVSSSALAADVYLVCELTYVETDHCAVTREGISKNEFMNLPPVKTEKAVQMRYLLPTDQSTAEFEMLKVMLPSNGGFAVKKVGEDRFFVRLVEAN